MRTLGRVGVCLTSVGLNAILFAEGLWWATPSVVGLTCFAWLGVNAWSDA
jgi:hypothetical protein